MINKYIMDEQQIAKINPWSYRLFIFSLFSELLRQFSFFLLIIFPFILLPLP